MKALPIVPDLDVLCHIIACFLPSRVGGAVDALDFHCRVERLGQGVVVADARAAD